MRTIWSALMVSCFVGAIGGCQSWSQLGQGMATVRAYRRRERVRIQFRAATTTVRKQVLQPIPQRVQLSQAQALALGPWVRQHRCRNHRQLATSDSGPASASQLTT